MERETSLHTLGNLELLSLHKVAFLCSRNCPAEAQAKSRNWAAAQCEKGICVVSGFHSRIERDVLHCLLKGKQPIVLALAKGLTKQPEPELQDAFEAGRLLIVTRYAESVSHACEDSCFHRNRLMMQLADETVIAYASPGGKLEKLCRECPGVKISRL